MAELRAPRLTARLLLPIVAALWPLALFPAGAGTDDAERIVEALGLCEGMSVADVGAGDGDQAALLARRVGPSGRVFATEVEGDKVEELEARAERDGLANLSAVLGDQRDTGLPAGCCDAILLRMVYHHFTDPPAMRRSLWRALRPGGRIAVVEVPPRTSWRHLEGVPERGGHGIPRDDLVAEMRSQGFGVLERHDDWPDEHDSYCVVFGKPGDGRPKTGPGHRPGP